jgi:hypothetical protein
MACGPTGAEDSSGPPAAGEPSVVPAPATAPPLAPASTGELATPNAVPEAVPLPATATVSPLLDGPVTTASEIVTDRSVAPAVCVTTDGGVTTDGDVIAIDVSPAAVPGAGVRLTVPAAAAFGTAGCVTTAADGEDEITAERSGEASEEA